MSESLRGQSARGWRIHWTHATSSDRFVGELWPDRATAEAVAIVLAENRCRAIQVMRAYS